MDQRSAVEEFYGGGSGFRRDPVFTRTASSGHRKAEPWPHPGATGEHRVADRGREPRGITSGFTLRDDGCKDFLDTTSDVHFDPLRSI